MRRVWASHAARRLLSAAVCVSSYPHSCRCCCYYGSCHGHLHIHASHTRRHVHNQQGGKPVRALTHRVAALSTGATTATTAAAATASTTHPSSPSLSSASRYGKSVELWRSRRLFARLLSHGHDTLLPQLPRHPARGDDIGTSMQLFVALFEATRHARHAGYGEHDRSTWYMHGPLCSMAQRCLLAVAAQDERAWPCMHSDARGWDGTNGTHDHPSSLPHCPARDGGRGGQATETKSDDDDVTMSRAATGARVLDSPTRRAMSRRTSDSGVPANDERPDGRAPPPMRLLQACRSAVGVVPLVFDVAALRPHEQAHVIHLLTPLQQLAQSLRALCLRCADHPHRRKREAGDTTTCGSHSDAIAPHLVAVSLTEQLLASLSGLPPYDLRARRSTSARMPAQRCGLSDLLDSVVMQLYLVHALLHPPCCSAAAATRAPTDLSSSDADRYRAVAHGMLETLRTQRFRWREGGGGRAGRHEGVVSRECVGVAELIGAAMDSVATGVDPVVIASATQTATGDDDDDVRTHGWKGGGAHGEADRTRRRVSEATMCATSALLRLYGMLLPHSAAAAASSSLSSSPAATMQSPPPRRRCRRVSASVAHGVTVLQRHWQRASAAVDFGDRALVALWWSQLLPFALEGWVRVSAAAAAERRRQTGPSTWPRAQTINSSAGESVWETTTGRRSHSRTPLVAELTTMQSALSELLRQLVAADPHALTGSNNGSRSDAPDGRGAAAVRRGRRSLFARDGVTDVLRTAAGAGAGAGAGTGDGGDPHPPRIATSPLMTAVVWSADGVARLTRACRDREGGWAGRLADVWLRLTMAAAAAAQLRRATALSCPDAAWRGDGGGVLAAEWAVWEMRVADVVRCWGGVVEALLRADAAPGRPRRVSGVLGRAVDVCDDDDGDDAPAAPPPPDTRHSHARRLVLAAGVQCVVLGILVPPVWLSVRSSWRFRCSTRRAANAAANAAAAASPGCYGPAVTMVDDDPCRDELSGAALMASRAVTVRALSASRLSDAEVVYYSGQLVNASHPPLPLTAFAAQALASVVVAALFTHRERWTLTLPAAAAEGEGEGEGERWGCGGGGSASASASAAATCRNGGGGRCVRESGTDAACLRTALRQLCDALCCRDSVLRGVCCYPAFVRTLHPLLPRDRAAGAVWTSLREAGVATVERRDRWRRGGGGGGGGTCAMRHDEDDRPLPEYAEENGDDMLCEGAYSEAVLLMTASLMSCAVAGAEAESEALVLLGLSALRRTHRWDGGRHSAEEPQHHQQQPQQQDWFVQEDKPPSPPLQQEEEQDEQPYSSGHVKSRHTRADVTDTPPPDVEESIAGGAGRWHRRTLVYVLDESNALLPRARVLPVWRSHTDSLHRAWQHYQTVWRTAGGDAGARRRTAAAARRAGSAGLCSVIALAQDSNAHLLGALLRCVGRFMVLAGHHVHRPLRPPPLPPPPRRLLSSSGASPSPVRGGAQEPSRLLPRGGGGEVSSEEDVPHGHLCVAPPRPHLSGAAVAVLTEVSTWTLLFAVARRLGGGRGSWVALTWAMHVAEAARRLLYAAPRAHRRVARAAAVEAILTRLRTIPVPPAVADCNRNAVGGVGSPLLLSVGFLQSITGLSDLVAARPSTLLAMPRHTTALTAWLLHPSAQAYREILYGVKLVVRHVEEAGRWYRVGGGGKEEEEEEEENGAAGWNYYTCYDARGWSRGAGAKAGGGEEKKEEEDETIMSAAAAGGRTRPAVGPAAGRWEQFCLYLNSAVAAMDFILELAHHHVVVPAGGAVGSVERADTTATWGGSATTCRVTMSAELRGVLASAFVSLCHTVVETLRSLEVVRRRGIVRGGGGRAAVAAAAAAAVTDLSPSTSGADQPTYPHDDDDNDDDGVSNTAACAPSFCWAREEAVLLWSGLCMSAMMAHVMAGSDAMQSTSSVRFWCAAERRAARKLIEAVDTLLTAMVDRAGGRSRLPPPSSSASSSSSSSSSRRPPHGALLCHALIHGGPWLLAVTQTSSPSAMAGRLAVVGRDRVDLGAALVALRALASVIPAAAAGRGGREECDGEKVGAQAAALLTRVWGQLCVGVPCLSHSSAAAASRLPCGEEWVGVLSCVDAAADARAAGVGQTGEESTGQRAAGGAPSRVREERATARWARTGSAQSLTRIWLEEEADAAAAVAQGGRSREAIIDAVIDQSWRLCRAAVSAAHWGGVGTGHDANGAHRDDDEKAEEAEEEAEEDKIIDHMPAAVRLFYDNLMTILHAYTLVTITNRPHAAHLFRALRLFVARTPPRRVAAVAAAAAAAPRVEMVWLTHQQTFYRHPRRDVEALWQRIGTKWERELPPYGLPSSPTSPPAEWDGAASAGLARDVFGWPGGCVSEAGHSAMAVAHGRVDTPGMPAEGWSRPGVSPKEEGRGSSGTGRRPVPHGIVAVAEEAGRNGFAATDDADDGGGGGRRRRRREMRMNMEGTGCGGTVCHTDESQSHPPPPPPPPCAMRIDTIKTDRRDDEDTDKGGVGMNGEGGGVDAQEKGSTGCRVDDTPSSVAAARTEAAHIPLWMLLTLLRVLERAAVASRHGTTERAAAMRRCAAVVCRYAAWVYVARRTCAAHGLSGVVRRLWRHAAGESTGRAADREGGDAAVSLEAAFRWAQLPILRPRLARAVAQYGSTLGDCCRDGEEEEVVVAVEREREGRRCDANAEGVDEDTDCTSRAAAAVRRQRWRRWYEEEGLHVLHPHGRGEGAPPRHTGPCRLVPNMDKHTRRSEATEDGTERGRDDDAEAVPTTSMEQVGYDYLRCGALYGYVLTLIWTVMIRHGLGASPPWGTHDNNSNSNNNNNNNNSNSNNNNNMADMQPMHDNRPCCTVQCTTPDTKDRLHRVGGRDSAHAAHGTDTHSWSREPRAAEDDMVHVFGLVQRHWRNVWWVMMRHANSITHAAVDAAIASGSPGGGDDGGGVGGVYAGGTADAAAPAARAQMEWARAVRELVAGALQDSIDTLTRPPASRMICQWIWHTCLTVGDAELEVRWPTRRRLATHDNQSSHPYNRHHVYNHPYGGGSSDGSSLSMPIVHPVSSLLVPLSRLCRRSESGLPPALRALVASAPELLLASPVAVELWTPSFVASASGEALVEHAGSAAVAAVARALMVHLVHRTDGTPALGDDGGNRDHGKDGLDGGAHATLAPLFGDGTVLLSELMRATTTLLSATRVRNTTQHMFCERLAKEAMARPALRAALTSTRPIVASSVCGAPSARDGRTESVANDVLIPFLAAMARRDVHVTRKVLANLLHGVMRGREGVFGQPPLASRTASCSIVQAASVAATTSGAYAQANSAHYPHKVDRNSTRRYSSSRSSSNHDTSTMHTYTTDNKSNGNDGGGEGNETAVLDAFAVETPSPWTHRDTLHQLQLDLPAVMEVMMHMHAMRGLTREEFTRASGLLRAADDARRERVALGLSRAVAHSNSNTNGSHAKTVETSSGEMSKGAAAAAAAAVRVDAGLRLQDRCDFGVAMLHLRYALRKIVHASARRLGRHLGPQDLADVMQVLQLTETTPRVSANRVKNRNSNNNNNNNNDSDSSPMSSSAGGGSSSARMQANYYYHPRNSGAAGDAMLSGTMRVLLARAVFCAQALGYTTTTAQPQRIYAKTDGGDGDHTSVSGAWVPLLNPPTDMSAAARRRDMQRRESDGGGVTADENAHGCTRNGADEEAALALAFTKSPSAVLTTRQWVTMRRLARYIRQEKQRQRRLCAQFAKSSANARRPWQGSQTTV